MVKKRESKVSVTISKSSKDEIISLIKDRRYSNISDFLRKAVHRLLDDEARKRGDILKEDGVKRFVEEIS